VVRAGGEQSGDHRAGRLSVGKCADLCPLSSNPSGFGRVDDDLVLEQARVRCDSSQTLRRSAWSPWMPSAGESSLLFAVSSWTVGSGAIPEL
jgi:hypothetical protein